MGQQGALGGSFIHRVGHTAVSSAQDCRYIACLKAVGKVLLQQLIGGGNSNGTQLMQAQNGKPELIVALEHQHHPVAPLDAQSLEIVCGSGRFLFHIPEGEPPLGAILAQVEHCQLLRLAAAQSIHHIKGEVKLLLVPEGDFLQSALIDRGENKVAVDPLFLVGHHLGVRHCGYSSRLLPLTGSGVAQNDGIECAILAVHSDHAVGRGRIVVDAVSGMEHFRLLTDLDAHMAANDDVTFLSLVGDQLNILILRTRAVADLHIQWQGNTVAEACGQVKAHHMVCLLNPLSLTLAGQCIGAQLGAAAFQQVGHIHAEAESAAVQERNAQIAVARLALLILFHAQIRALSHLLHAQARDLTQLTDSAGHLLDLIRHSGHFLFHCMYLRMYLRFL